MGIYLNPKSMSKETFLNKYGEEVFEQNPKRIWDSRPGGTYPVVLVYNATFTAAGVADSLQELSRFLDPEDPRPKLIFYVKLADMVAEEALLPTEARKLRPH